MEFSVSTILASDKRVDVLSFIEQISEISGRPCGSRLSRSAAVKKLASYVVKDSSKGGILADLGTCRQTGGKGRASHVFQQGPRGLQELTALYSCMSKTKQVAWKWLYDEVQKYISAPVRSNNNLICCLI